MTSAVPAETPIHSHTYICFSLHTGCNCKAHLFAVAVFRGQMQKWEADSAKMKTENSANPGSVLKQAMRWPITSLSQTRSHFLKLLWVHGKLIQLLCWLSFMAQSPGNRIETIPAVTDLLSSKQELRGLVVPPLLCHSLGTARIWRHSAGKCLCNLCSFMSLQTLKRSSHDIIPC